MVDQWLNLELMESPDALEPLAADPGVRFFSKQEKINTSRDC
jgi:hypothetical protein